MLYQNKIDIYNTNNYMYIYNTKFMNISKEITYYDNKTLGFTYNLYVKEHKMSYINIIVNINEKSSILTDFTSIKPNKGFGSKVLNYVINDMKNEFVNKITLDDMSTAYREKHNIYIKFGFTYLYEYGPEMVLFL